MNNKSEIKFCIRGNHAWEEAYNCHSHKYRKKILHKYYGFPSIGLKKEKCYDIRCHKNEFRIMIIEDNKCLPDLNVYGEIYLSAADFAKLDGLIKLTKLDEKCGLAHNSLNSYLNTYKKRGHNHVFTLKESERIKEEIKKTIKLLKDTFALDE